MDDKTHQTDPQPQQTQPAKTEHPSEDALALLDGVKGIELVDITKGYA